MSAKEYRDKLGEIVFKLGVITDEISQDFRHAIKVTKELGMTHVELRSLWGKSVVNLSEEELREARRIIQEEGLKVAIISPGFLKANILNEKEYQRHLQIFKRAVEIAKLFDINLVRVFSFWRVEGEKYWKMMIEKLRQVVDLAKDEGVILALENEGACIVGTGRETRRVLEEIKSPCLRALWDPGNAFTRGETPYPDGYLEVRNYIIHMHIKDAIKVSSEGKVRYRWVAIGSGEIDYRGQLKALVEDGYEGVVSIETHYSIDGDKEAATRETFKGLKRLLEEIGVNIG